MDFMSTLCQHPNEAWQNELTDKMRALLKSRTVHIDDGRKPHRAEALKPLLF